MEEVIQQIQFLHASGGVSANSATRNLEQWQRSSQCTWDAIFQLLQVPDDLVAFFASNTAVTKAQLGGNVDGEKLLQRIISINGNSTKAPIRRQLCTAYADLAIYGHVSLEAGVQTLKDEALLDLLTTFPEEAVNYKVLVTEERRLQFIQTLLSNQLEVFDVLVTKNNPKKILEATDKWLTLTQKAPGIFAAKESGARYTSDVFKKGIHEHPVVKLACDQILTPNCEQAVNVLSSLLQLTNEVTPQTSEAIRITWESITKLAMVVSPDQETDPHQWELYAGDYTESEDRIQRMQHISKLIGEWGQLFYRGLQEGKPMENIPKKKSNRFGYDPVLNALNLNRDMFADEDPLNNAPDTPNFGSIEVEVAAHVAPQWIERIGDIALHWMTIQHTEIARGGFDFWRKVLITNTHDNRIFENELKPWLEKFMKKCLIACRFPEDPESSPHFDTSEFTRLRDSCQHSITETASVIPTDWIIELIGNQLPHMVKWNDLDTGIFILTSVAPKAKAGSDDVIPKMLEHLPNIQYPNRGAPGIILRASAVKLILFTSGYLASQRQKLISVLQFVLTNLMPSLLIVEQSDLDLRQYAEAICVDALKVVTFSAKEQIMGTITEEYGGGEQFWPDLISQLIIIAKNSKYHEAVRIQLCIVIGQIISFLPDGQELEKIILEFTNTMQPSPDLITPPDGKTPEELKIYLACLTSLVYHPEHRGPINDVNHPIVQIWEKCFANLQNYTIVAVRHNFEDWLQQLCVSLNFAFSCCKMIITNSPFFAKSLRMLGEAAEAKPLNCYYTFLRQTMTIFAHVGDPELDRLLVELLGTYAVPVARGLQNNNFSPEVVANCYEMLGDSLRWSNLANGALQSSWLPHVFDPAMDSLESDLEITTHDKALSAILGFFCSFIRWSTEGPDIVHLSRNLWEGRIPRVVHICVKLLAKCAENPYSPTVSAVAEVIRPLLTGSMEFEAKNCLKQSFGKLPKPLTKTNVEVHQLVQTLTVEKVDAHRFCKQLQDTVTEFHGQLKRSLASSA